MKNHPQIHYLSRGIVVKNKIRGSKQIMAWPVDILPEVNSELSDSEQQLDIRGIDPDGGEVTIKVKRGAAITAIWKGDTNRVTAPDVRRGERVDLYRVGDSEIYYWESAGLDDDLRRLETVIYSWNANPNNADATPDETNCYTYEVNTHDGHVTFRTSMANGEAAMFISQYNLKKGVYSLECEKGNYVYIDSVNTDIMIENADGSYFQLIKDVINLKTRVYNIECEDHNVTSTKTTWKNNDGWKLNTGTASIDSGNTVLVKGGGTVTINGSVVNIN